MSVSLIRIACFASFLVLAAVVLPAVHGVHETVDHHCTLCQLRHSSIGEVVEVQAVIDDFESKQWSRPAFVRFLDSLPRLPSGSRAPPA